MPAQKESTTIDVVVPVFNAFDQVKRCLGSLLRHADDHVRLIVVDDGSHEAVRDWLTASLATDERCKLILLDQNGGYLKAANTGLKHTASDIVIVQNSDTIIFHGFYDRLRDTFRNDDRIGIVNPVSVWANWTRIPFPQGHTIFSLEQAISERYRDEICEIKSASGFSFAIRRKVLDTIGEFDERFSPGYWEETDYCMRALVQGWKVVCAKGLFVFHNGWSSFGAQERNRHMERNEYLFRSIWSERYSEIELKQRLSDPLREMRAQIERLPADSLIEGRSSSSENYRVIYVLPSLALYGGVISVVQVVNQLVLRGVDAGIAVVGGRDTSALRYGPAYFSPLFFEDEESFLRDCPATDILVATHWTTAYLVKKIVERQKKTKCAYFVQDYEPDFHFDDSQKRAMAEMSYEIIEDRICKTDWLKRKLDAFGGRNHIVPLGLNEDVFFDQGGERRNMVVSMARPTSARRNWKTARRVFELLSQQRPDIELGVYGFGFKKEELPPSVTNFGLLNTGVEVANMLNKVRLLLDVSHYQGFGRPGVEAMACGVVPILTKNGGVTSYATHRYNTLLVDPFDVVGIFEAVCSLVDDSALYERLLSNGNEIVSRYMLEQEGAMTDGVFRALLDNQSYLMNDKAEFGHEGAAH